ncbi:tetratricopeptide repeat protein [Erythrobacter sp. JGD-13]|uniref:Tetratricopeptide repeat protein n=2 Tax=Aurantiacibacter sediminis TaxID=2793064 RepID=A0ABS0N340_9SPHN|nr:tetratricopeptide repeat protein [Aurantiacibacter sediminis]
MKAQAAERSGNRDAARAILLAGLEKHPKEPGLHHALGKWYLSQTDAGSAVEHFRQAAQLAPENIPFAIDQAIALSTAKQFREAIAVLKKIEDQAKDSPAYCSTRGLAERGSGDLAAAAHWYDKALSLEPERIRALHGRATVALERGEPDAVARFDANLTRDRSDAYQWYGKAQALDAEGRTDEARKIAEMLVKQVPQWTDALKLLAQLRLAVGETDYTAHYAEAAAKVPQDPNIAYEHATLLAGLEDYPEALEVVERARKHFPKVDHFTLMEATYAGALGELDHAESLFQEMRPDNEQRWTQEARHAVRLGEHGRADKAIERALAHNPFSVTAWAIRGILWRMADDPRADWLHGQRGLVAMVDLHDAHTVLPPAVDRLKQLHDRSAMPIGQSLRGGTQTRGNLFDRHEPEFQALRDAVLSTLEEYRASLPAVDETHPLLRYRTARWTVSGSWSVRLGGGGDRHATHIHPEGIISSALYCELPDEVGATEGHEGWIELGRPPIDLPLELDPLFTLQPREGALALFPSTLYHGTRPFADGRRMTVAFDVTAPSEAI